MIKKISITLLIIWLTTYFAKPSLSEPSLIEIEPSQECFQTLSDVFTRIESIGAKRALIYAYKNDANKNYYGNPTNRKARLRIVMIKDEKNNNNRVGDIMNSEVLLNNWSNKIVKSCIDVAIVEYGVWRTSYVVSFFIQENEVTKVSECIDWENSIGIDKLPWNLEVCGL